MKRWIETVVMLLLIIIGLIPLIADSADPNIPTNNGVDITPMAFSSAVVAGGSTTSINGKLSVLPLGSNRLLLVALYYNVPTGTGAIVKSVTVGGLPATQIGAEMTVSQRIWVGYINEAAIASLAATPVIEATFEKAPTFAQARVAVYVKVNQTSPIAGFLSNGSDTAAQQITFGTGPLSIPIDGMGLYFLNSDETNPNTQTPPSGFLETFEALAATYFDTSEGEVFQYKTTGYNSGTGMALTNAARYGVIALSLAPS